MSSVVRPAEKTAVESTTATWGAGFRNLMKKEWASWTRSRSWWLQPLIWLTILVGPLLLPLYAMREVFASQTDGVLAVANEMFFGLASLAPAVGAVLFMQGSIIAERQLGTAAWVLSKPVARSAFLLSKLAAHGSALLAASLVLPGLVAYLLLSAEAGVPMSPADFLLALGLDALNITFYLTLTLALGAVNANRVVVLAVPLAALLGADLVLSLVPSLGNVTPWLLGRLAPFLARGEVAFSAVAAPIAATLVWSALFVLTGLVRFGKEDL